MTDRLAKILVDLFEGPSYRASFLVSPTKTEQNVIVKLVSAGANLAWSEIHDGWFLYHPN